MTVSLPSYFSECPHLIWNSWLWYGIQLMFYRSSCSKTDNYLHELLYLNCTECSWQEKVKVDLCRWKFVGIRTVSEGSCELCWALCCSVAQSCPTLCSPTDCSIPGFPVLYYLPKFPETPVHWVDDAISQLFTSGGQSIGASASASVF